MPIHPTVTIASVAVAIGVISFTHGFWHPILFSTFLYKEKPNLPWYIGQFWACLLTSGNLLPINFVSQKNDCLSLEETIGYLPGG